MNSTTPTGPQRAESETKTSIPADDRTPPKSLFNRIDAGLVVVLTLPLVILRLDTTWLFGYATSPFGFIDPWVYFGYFLDLTQHLRSFKGAYFTTRLTWTVPGAIVYGLFTPVVATYVLHLALFYGSILSLYFILRGTVSHRAALLATVLMAFHSYFLWSIGWPYIDGAGNTYALLTLAALTRAARSRNANRWIFVAGVLAAMAIYCQFFLIVFSPVVFGFYYFARREFGNQRNLAEWRPFAWGFAAITILFGIFNMAVNGRFLFFINAVGTAAKLVINHNPYDDPTYGWLSGATWLVLPAVVLMGAFICLRRRRIILSLPNAEFLLFWQRYYLLSVLILLFWQLVGQPVLQLSTYSSYLLPGVFLALGSQIAIVTRKLTAWQFVLLSTAVFVVSVYPLLVPVDSPWLLLLSRHQILLPLTIGFVAVAAIATRIPRIGTFAVILLATGLGVLNATTSTRTWDHGNLPHDPASQRYALLAVADSVHAVQGLDPKGNVYFWYNGTSRLGRLYRSSASTYLWAYRLQSETFPELGPKLPPEQRHIVILTEDADGDLPAAQEALAKVGLRGTVVSKHTIQEGPFTWQMIEIQISRT